VTSATDDKALWFVEELAAWKIHKSHFQAWMRCPRLFYYRYVAGEPVTLTDAMLVGIEVDWGIEEFWKYFRPEYMEEERDPYQFFRDVLESFLPEYPQTCHHWADHLRELWFAVQQTYPENPWDIFAPFAVQFPFEVPYPPAAKLTGEDVKLAGTIDFLRYVAEKQQLAAIEVGEIKCSRRVFGGNFFTEVRRELVFYQTALSHLEEDFPYRPLLPFKYHSIINPLLGKDMFEKVHGATVKAFLGNFMTFITALVEGKFPRNMNNCARCDYTRQCLSSKYCLARLELYRGRDYL